jgi:carbonic anhydrase/acetyltransferase-like protein (isoleucine patch superfamily)
LRGIEYSANILRTVDSLRTLCDIDGSLPGELSWRAFIREFALVSRFEWGRRDGLEYKADAAQDRGLMQPFIRSFKGKCPKVLGRCFIAETAAVLGDVEISAEASVWYGVTLRGDGNMIRIGERANVQDGTVVHVDKPADRMTSIGNGATVGHACIIHACVLHDHAFVGMGSTVLDGAVIESEGMLAAHSLLPPGKIIKSGEVWAGVPAKLWRPIKLAELEMIYYIRDTYWATAQDFMEDMDPDYLSEWRAY